MTQAKSGSGRSDGHETKENWHVVTQWLPGGDWKRKRIACVHHCTCCGGSRSLRANHFAEGGTRKEEKGADYVIRRFLKFRRGGEKKMSLDESRRQLSRPKRWCWSEKSTIKIKSRKTRSKETFNWRQRHFIFVIVIDISYRSQNNAFGSQKREKKKRKTDWQPKWKA